MIGFADTSQYTKLCMRRQLPPDGFATGGSGNFSLPART